jgi:hypothetical protein
MKPESLLAQRTRSHCEPVSRDGEWRAGDVLGLSR